MSEIVVVLSIIVVTLGMIGAWFILQCVDLKRKLVEWEDKYKKVLSQKKSSEVRLGRIGENMAPFFANWPYDPNHFRFLGNPVDGIQFTNDSVIFVEIKTGKARLSDSQKHVKSLIKEGKVEFATFRVGEDGCSFKIEENDEVSAV